jgi:hypothetical protein
LIAAGRHDEGVRFVLRVTQLTADPIQIVLQFSFLINLWLHIAGTPQRGYQL